jgi:NAD(P)-dependent dehydrogenase (short-subunit alcohol dehydrogenase family)
VRAGGVKRLAEGKVVLVTGAASGIGRASARLFAAEGARVICADITVKGGQETVALIHKDGGDAVFVNCDVTHPAGVAQTVRAAVEQFGRLDCAFNNAGIEGPNDTLLGDYDLEDFDRVVAVNLRGLWLCMRHVIPPMVRQGSGVIVNMASVSGLAGTATLSTYSASKHGVIGLTRSAAREYAASGLRINAICPGGTRTAMAAETFGGDVNDDAQMRALARAAGIPMLRLAEPPEIAEAVVWLCSDRASYVTGVALPVDGGFSCGWGWQTPSGKIRDQSLNSDTGAQR